ncbi:hypothetical protein FGG08_000801 [Glutinoglossum americanum]|uniref:Actin cytoskeleton-regulatory complex protein SLA1 n=1 Tax=Glutinoglossum americanum TaxID=1670608 RepID=A0A9P8ICD5_9PEZI|nr:hypothetical protein FGG08_000801 [Glutinoglossum americanum]
MGFLGIYTALYAYVPQSDQELAIEEGDLLYIIEKSTEDDWWKAKKRAEGDEDEEPVGLIPSNYIEEAKPLHHVKALYDYTRQTDEEISLSEGANLSIYDTSDPDWTLVGFNGEYGFAPANYIDTTEVVAQPASQRAISVKARDSTAEPDEPSADSPNSHPQSPAAAIAGIIQRKSSASASDVDPGVSSSSPVVDLPPRRPTYTPDVSDDEGPPQPAPGLPARPKPEQNLPSPTHATQYISPRPPESPGILASPPHIRAAHSDPHSDVGSPQPGGFHLYNISEMVYVMGKQKKLPTTLGINTATGKILVAPARQDAPQQEWTADKLNHYSIEGKHVFMELVRPSRSLDFHAGAKDTAQEIVSALGEVAGAFRAEGLREVLEAGVGGKSQKTGKILYDFVAQGDDEVTVAVDDEVVILDSMKSEEWWQVRRVKNGKEGVVPSSYVELTGVTPIQTPSMTGTITSRSITENKLEEDVLERGAESSRRNGGGETKGPEVGPGVKLPQRGSSLLGRDSSNSTAKQRNKRESRGDGKSPTTSKQKPDATRTRTWTDRSGSFKVEAEFLGCRDGKIHLHKLNGVKIAVPVVKMSVEDLEYVERVTGMSLDEDKPLSDIRRQKSQATGVHGGVRATPTVGATVDHSKKGEYDWFDFFLKCGVDVNLCQRYATNFSKDSMDETVLPDITPSVLRTLGLKEGDILRVMKYLDNKYGRVSAKAKRNVSFGGAEVMGNDEGEEGDRKASNGGLFSGPGGALRNNTRKGRPTPAVQTSDVVDPKAFGRKDNGDEVKTTVTPEAVSSPSAPTLVPQQKDPRGFDDDAWDVKPSKQQPQPQPQSNVSSPASTVTQTSASQQPTLTGSLRELSLLSPALQPTVVHSGGQQHTQQPPEPQPAQPVQQQQPGGATPSFFSQLSQQKSGGQLQQNNVPQAPPLPNLSSPSAVFGQQQTSVQFQPSTMPPAPPLPALVSHTTNYLPQQSQQTLIPRQRPQAPHITQSQGSLMPPPPPRPLSAPQNFSQPNGFSIPPLQQQLTGYQNQPSNFAAQITSLVQPPNDPRLQPQYGGQQVQPVNAGFAQQGNGLAPQPTGFAQYQASILSQPTGFGQPFHQLPPQQTGIQSPQVYVNGQTTGSLFGNQGQQQQTGSFQPVLSQPTGPQSPFPPIPQQQQQTSSINSLLPPALQPQPTGQTNNFGPNSGQGPFRQALQPVPPIPKQPTLAPLQAQKTGPAPPVRFGVTGDMKKLTPQPTGRRANLSQAMPTFPFRSPPSLMAAQTSSNKETEIKLSPRIPQAVSPETLSIAIKINLDIQRTGVEDLLRRKDKSKDNDVQSSSQANSPVPEFTFVRTDTNTVEYITPPSFTGDITHPVATTQQQQHKHPHSLLNGRRPSTTSISSERGERRLSERLHLRSHSRNASSSSVNLPQDLPDITDGKGEKEDQEAEWEHRATLLARGSRHESSQPGDTTTLEPNTGRKSRSMSVSSSSGDDNIQEAIRLHEASELERSTTMFGKLADPKGSNIALAQVLYGLALRHGWGCAPNPEKAIFYLSAAAQNSADVETQALKAGMKKGGAAKGELVLAIFELANCYRHGWGVPVDPIAAQQFYLTAANLGDTDAMNEVAWCYLEGFGCKKDKVSEVANCAAK